jgi:hypothetical protein
MGRQPAGPTFAAMSCISSRLVRWRSSPKRSLSFSISGCSAFILPSRVGLGQREEHAFDAVAQDRQAEIAELHIEPLSSQNSGGEEPEPAPVDREVELLDAVLVGRVDHAHDLGAGEEMAPVVRRCHRDGSRRRIDGTSRCPNRSLDGDVDLVFWSARVAISICGDAAQRRSCWISAACPWSDVNSLRLPLKTP